MAHCGHFEHNIQTAASSSRTCNSTSPENSKVETSYPNATWRWHFIKIYSLFLKCKEKRLNPYLGLLAIADCVWPLKPSPLDFHVRGGLQAWKKAWGKFEDFFSSLSTCLWVTRNLLEQPRDFHSVSNLHSHPITHDFLIYPKVQPILGEFEELSQFSAPWVVPSRGCSARKPGANTCVLTVEEL